MPDRTPGGSNLLRYDHVTPNHSAPTPVPEAQRGAVEAHLERFLGPVQNVFQEIVSETVRIDLLFFGPSTDRPYITMVTHGVSDRELSPPEGMEQWRRIELLTYLPPTWNLDFQNGGETAWWPGRLLKTLGRFVHSFQTYFGPGHTIPNGNPVTPYVPGSKLTTALLLDPVFEADGFAAVPGADLRFLSVVPITDQECKLKLDHGLDALLQVAAARGVSSTIDPSRACVLEGQQNTFEVFAPELPESEMQTNEKKEMVELAMSVIRSNAPTDRKIHAAAKLMTESMFHEAGEAWKMLGQAHPELHATAASQVGAAHFFVSEYNEAIHWYRLAEGYGEDPNVVQDNIQEAEERLRGLA